MDEGEFMAIMLFGMMAGSIVTLLIQWYGHRRAKKAARRDDDGVNMRRQVELLAGVSERQLGQIDRLQERLAVLEQIAIDPAQRTAREIEALRVKEA